MLEYTAMYEYQRKKRFFAQTADDIKDICEQELKRLGARDTSPSYRGIYFSADTETLYRINYTSRLSTRILAPLSSFDCRSTDQLYTHAAKMTWTDFLSAGKTFAVFSNVSNSKITNSHYASLRLKDAVVDSVRTKTGKRPDIDAKSPDVWLNLHIRNNRAVISIDTSGSSLHRRGYRKDSVEAPMQETVAAAIIAYSGWDGSVPLYDPMCGSGTLLCEALMHYCWVPSGVLRTHFGFERLPDYNKSIWIKVKKETDSRMREPPSGILRGSDMSPEAVNITRSNAVRLPYGDRINLEVLDFKDSAGLEKGIIVANPPYGIRTGEKDELNTLYKSLGDFLKKKCKGSGAYIYFGDREYIKKIGLKPTWKKPLESGGLDGRLVKYELF